MRKELTSSVHVEHIESDDPVKREEVASRVVKNEKIISAKIRYTQRRVDQTLEKIDSEIRSSSRLMVDFTDAVDRIGKTATQKLAKIGYFDRPTTPVERSRPSVIISQTIESKARNTLFKHIQAPIKQKSQDTVIDSLN